MAQPQSVVYSTHSQNRAERALNYLQQTSPDEHYQVIPIQRVISPVMFRIGPFPNESQAKTARAHFIKNFRSAKLLVAQDQYYLITPKIFAASDERKYRQLIRKFSQENPVKEIQIPMEEQVTIYQIVRFDTPAEPADSKETSETNSSNSGGGLLIIAEADESVSDFESIESDDPSDTAGSLFDGSGFVFLEPLYFSESETTGGYGLLRLGVEAFLTSDFSFHASGRIHALTMENQSQTAPLLDELYLKQRWGNFHTSIGWQKVIWGRVFENSIFDRLTRMDLFRGIEGQLEDRRLGLPMLYMEWIQPFWKLEGFYSNTFEGPVLAEPGQNPWALVNQDTGSFPHSGEDPLTQLLIRNGQFQNNIQMNETRWGLRASASLSGYDLGATYLETAWNEPYYHLNPKVMGLLLSGLPPDQAISAAGEDTFLLFAPKTTISGIDFRGVFGPITLGLELGHISDYPITNSASLPDTIPIWMGILSIEFFPGDSDDRVNLQIVGAQGDFQDTLEEEPPLYFLAQWESFWGNKMWKGIARSSYFPNDASGTLNLGLTWLRFEPHYFSLNLYSYYGSSQSLPGAWKDAQSLGLAWSFRF